MILQILSNKTKIITNKITTLIKCLINKTHLNIIKTIHLRINKNSYMKDNKVHQLVAQQEVMIRKNIQELIVMLVKT